MKEINVVFMCGALRSGSSLMHLMLNHHPKVKNPGEFDFLFDLVSDEGAFPEINLYHDWLSTHRIFHSKSLVIDKSLAYEDLIFSFVQQLTEGDSVLVLNIHRGFHRIPFLFSNAKYIHLIRDPRDVARSSIGMGWAGNVYYGVDHWVNSEQDWKHLEAKVSANQFFQVHFEELIMSPKPILSEVCGFLGLGYSEQMMGYTDNSTYSKPDASLVNQWKVKLLVKELQYVEFKASSLMLDLGYELSGKPFVSIGTVEGVWLKVTNKIFRVRYAVKKYGVGLYFKERFSRFFGLVAVNKQARIAINGINKRNLK